MSSALCCKCVDGAVSEHMNHMISWAHWHHGHESSICGQYLWWTWEEEQKTFYFVVRLETMTKAFLEEVLFVSVFTRPAHRRYKKEYRGVRAV